jgi:hypothetical protein
MLRWSKDASSIKRLKKESFRDHNEDNEHMHVPTISSWRCSLLEMKKNEEE